MPGATSFRQVDEKHVSFEVDRMLWSPKMDLIAVASVVGEVALHRLSWQKVWTLASPSEGTKVLSLAWRPDGKILAVGYSTNVVHLCNVENAACIRTLSLIAAPTFMSWSADSQQTGEPNEDSGTDDYFHEMSSRYLPKLPSFEKSYADSAKPNGDELAEDKLKLKGQTSLNILVVGTDGNELEMYAYGVVHMCTLHLEEKTAGKIGKVVSTLLSDDLDALSVVVETDAGGADNSPGIKLLMFDSSLLASQSRELRLAAHKLGHVLTLLSYMETAVGHMSEAWEDILLEMDSKLKKLAEDKYKVCGGSVSTDLFRLLMFGKPSDELKNFLLFTLTDKGLKKLGHSIESSYTNIQKLLLKHLQSVGQSLVYHLSDVHGLSMWPDKFGACGLQESATQQAVNVAGSFMLKASELQQVIDASLKNFKAFFRWLYVAMQRLAEEQIPSSLMKMSQQDLSFVAQFLRDNFTQDVAPHKSGFRLEKVGQYLKRQDLQRPVENSSNPWEKLVSESAHLRDSPLLFPTHPNLSLVQVYDLLSQSVDAVIQHCAKTIGQSIRCVSNVCLYSQNISHPFKTLITQCGTVCSSRKVIETAFALTSNQQPDQFFICRQSINAADSRLEVAALKCGLISAQQIDCDNPQLRCRQHAILDLAFYDDKMLSLLLLEADRDNGRPALILIPLPAAYADGSSAFRDVSAELRQQKLCLDQLGNTVDIGGAVESASFRMLDNMKASKFAISGTRKVACVLFASQRRVRLFLMDVEDEDEDEQTTDVCQQHDSHLDDSRLDDSHELTSATDDNSLSVVEHDDENKENSATDVTTSDIF